MKDVQCRKCWGFGHIEQWCTSKRVMIVHDDGEYDSASDYDDDTLALIAARDEDNNNEDDDMEVMVVERVSGDNAWPNHES